MKFIILIFIFSSCNVLKTLTGGETDLDDNFFEGAKPNVELTFPEVKRTHYITDETTPREVFINYSGGDLECSINGGANWETCSSPYVWEIANYEIEHEFRVSNGDEHFSQNFKPSSEFPGLNFLTCDMNVTASESVSTFNGRSFSSGDIVCFEDGVVINNSGSDGSIGFPVVDVTMIARVGDTVTFNSIEANSIIDDFARRISVIGINITGNVASQKGINATQDGVIIEDVSINLSGNSVNGVTLSLSGGTAYIRNLMVSVPDIAASEALYLQNSNVEMHDSYLDAGYNAVYFWKNAADTYTLNAYNSTFIGRKTNAPNTSVGVLETYSNDASNSYVINLNSSSIQSSGGPAIYIKAAAGIVDLNLNDVKVERENYGNVDTGAIRLDSSGLTNTINVDSSTYFCNYNNTATHKFTSILDDQTSNVVFSATDMSSHSSNTDINICP